MSKSNGEFMQGVIWAAARIVEMHDEPVFAHDLLKAANVQDKDFETACEYDLEFLRRERPDIPKGQD